MKNKPRLLAYYLPQFHPIPENDEWWGKGFTEWTNVGKAKPLFPGHDQPKLPGELGYYDLRVPETREAQAQLAKEYGIDGFCYWHYWFGNGKQLLERPFNEVLESGKPDFPFCLAWANEPWKGFWHGLKDRQTLIEQLYLGERDYIDHFYSLLSAFKDPRYIKVEGKPIFMIYKPFAVPDINVFLSIWNKLAHENGLNGFYFVGLSMYDSDVDSIIQMGFDAVNLIGMNRYKFHRKPIKFAFLSKFLKIFYGCKQVAFYEDASRYFVSNLESRRDVIPTAISNWDHTPRTGKEGIVLHGSTPYLFKRHLKAIFEACKSKDQEHNIVLIKSWNEWAEGNYLEPDRVWGRQYLEVIKQALLEEG